MVEQVELGIGFAELKYIADRGVPEACWKCGKPFRKGIRLSPALKATVGVPFIYGS